MRGVTYWVSSMWSNTPNYVDVTVVWNTAGLGGTRIIRKWPGLCKAHHIGKGRHGGGDSDLSNSEGSLKRRKFCTEICKLLIGCPYSMLLKMQSSPKVQKQHKPHRIDHAKCLQYYSTQFPKPHPKSFPKHIATQASIFCNIPSGCKTQTWVDGPWDAAGSEAQGSGWTLIDLWIMLSTTVSVIGPTL